MNTIPLEAAKWIESYLASVGHALPEYKAEILRNQGLDILTITDFKLIWKGLGHTVYSQHKRKPRSGSKKADWVKATRECFYRDENCRSVNKEFLQHLSKTPTVTPPVAAAASVARAAAAATSSARSPTKKRRNSPARAPPPATAYPSHVPWIPPSMVHQGMAAAGMPYSAGMPFPAPDWNPWASMPPSAAPSHKSPSPRKKHKPRHAKVKTEPGHDSETHPQTPQEWQMVQSLKQMGFTDMREILAGIRHVQAVDMATRVDEAMMWIVSQREEVEEARKLDLARISSEAARAEQAQKRALETEQRLLNASMEELKRDFFKGSVLLEKACLESADKKDAIRLLKLDEKARKWYGTAVPWCYFCNLSERFDSMPKEQLRDEIKTESDQLEHIMYSLSEQQGGVPRLFLEARNEAKSKGLPTRPEPSGNVDGDVVVVEELLPNFNDERQMESSCNGSSMNGPNQEAEVIEIL